MAAANTSHESFVGDIVGTINEHLAHLKSELAGVVRDIRTQAPQASTGLETGQIADASFLGVVDALHALAPSIPEPVRRELKGMLYGMEDLHGLADGFIQALRESTSPDEVLKFEVSERRKGTNVVVALPPASYPFLVKDIDKTLRELRRLHGRIVRG